LAIVYIFVKAPTYEVRSNISIGNYSGSFIESPEVLIARTIIVHMENVQKEEIGVLKAVNLKKGTSNIIEFVVQSDTNQNAIKKLDNILQEIFAFHEEKITKYKNFNNDEIETFVKRINFLKKKKDFIKNNNELFVSIESQIYELNNKIHSLKQKNSDRMIKKSTKIGSYIVDENPIAPNKKLVVIIAFVMGFIFSIFFVFLQEFIIHFNDDLEKINV
jgi:hypothetical protein